MKYPTTEVEDPKRPFRLWNANEKKSLRWRCYAHLSRAHMGALIEVRWAKVGATIEVFDARNAKLLGQYTRRLNDIQFEGPQAKPNGGK